MEGSGQMESEPECDPRGLLNVSSILIQDTRFSNATDAIEVIGNTDYREFDEVSDDVLIYHCVVSILSKGM